MKTLDLRHHDTLTMAEFTAIFEERWQADEDIDAVIVLPTVAEQWKDDRIAQLEDKLELLKAGEIVPELIDPYQPSLEAAVERLEGYIDSMKNPPDNSLVRYTDLIVTAFGQCEIIVKNRGEA